MATTISSGAVLHEEIARRFPKFRLIFVRTGITVYSYSNPLGGTHYALT